MTSSSPKSNEPAKAEPKPSNPHAPLTKADVRKIFYGLMLGMFLSALNQTIVATALPTIGRDFGDFENLSWVIIAYLLSSTVVSPLYGKLSDIHGRRAMMLLAIGLFLAGSVVSAAAPDMALLIAGRTLQGIGGGGIVPLTQTTIADMITPRERGRYQAYMGTSWIVAGVAGPALGGVIAEYLHWSVIFWLNVPFGLIAALLTYHAMKRLPRHERPHQLDIVGAALMIAAATLLLIALTSGGTRVPWISSTIFVLVLASLALSLAFVWWLRLAPEPFLPLTVLRNPVMRAGTAATSWMLGAVLGLTVYMPLYFQVVHKLSATEAGLALIPIVVMTTPGSMVSGRSMMHLRRYKISAIVGAIIAIANREPHRALCPTCHAALRRDHRAHADRLRRWHRLSGRNRLDSECRAGAPSRNRDRCHEFLPCAREYARGRDHGRDPARRPWRRARARHRRGAFGRDRRRRRYRHGGRIPVRIRRRRYFLDCGACRSAAHGGASAAGTRDQCAAGRARGAARASGVESLSCVLRATWNEANDIARYLVRTVSS